ncbi:LANO_0G13718g1_1 [Lachancea nothofagi CBS 11611]|uniref:LANO_0G13718g1_1 n=1 Tax=Lachancea nothofagi CBS 11611 TaxID=1266666 RepID=A0A1G4KKC1_9SACH|nr:LANO_0G13718g1_1 [Lachancea nothofagi CBS 11611]
MENNSSTPSLVGFSVRDTDDSNNPDFSDDRRPSVPGARSSSQLLEKIHSSTQLNKLETPYTTVDELNREGALLTDDNEVDLDQVVHGKLDDPGALKKALLKKKNKQATAAGISGNHRGRVPLPSSSTPSIASSSYSPSQTRSSSLVTSTDPVHGSVSASRLGNTAGNFPLRENEKDNDKIRNSYGEFISNRSHRPHLAGGDSYQSTTGHESEDSPRERSGRTSRKEDASRGYLRSLSRSLSRDPNKAHDQEVLDDALMYSTNNYRISRIDLENAPHVIKEEIEEEQDQGALLNDEGDDQYSPDLQEAASDQCKKL